MIYIRRLCLTLVAIFTLTNLSIAGCGFFSVLWYGDCQKKPKDFTCYQKISQRLAIQSPDGSFTYEIVEVSVASGNRIDCVTSQSEDDNCREENGC